MSMEMCPGLYSQTTSANVELIFDKDKLNLGYVDIASSEIRESTKRSWADVEAEVLEEDRDLWERLAKL